MLSLYLCLGAYVFTPNGLYLAYSSILVFSVGKIITKLNQTGGAPHLVVALPNFRRSLKIDRLDGLHHLP